MEWETLTNVTMHGDARKPWRLAFRIREHITTEQRKWISDIIQLIHLPQCSQNVRVLFLSNVRGDCTFVGPNYSVYSKIWEMGIKSANVRFN